MTNNSGKRNKTPRGGAAKPNASKTTKAAGPSSSAVAETTTTFGPKIDHTPPPVLIETGSIIIETDKPLIHTDLGLGVAHRHQHKFSTSRSVLGLRILDDAGKTVHRDDRAAGATVKIWWGDTSEDEQILIEGGSLNINTDVNLGSGVVIARPPMPTGLPPTQRTRRYVHPGTDARGILQVEVLKGGASSIFTERIDKVMIWDTSHD